MEMENDKTVHPVIEVNDPNTKKPEDPLKYMDILKRVISNVVNTIVPESRRDGNRPRKRAAEHFDPELTDDDGDEDIAPFQSVRKRIRAREANNVGVSSSLLLGNPWRNFSRAQAKGSAMQSANVVQISQATVANGDDVICLNGSSVTGSSTRKNVDFSSASTSATALSSSLLEKNRKFGNLKKSMKTKKPSLFDIVRGSRSKYYSPYILGTRQDTVRLEERNQYVKMLERLRGGSSLASGFSGFTKTSSPADSGRSSQTGVKPPLSKSRVPLSDMIYSEINWLSGSHTIFKDVMKNPLSTMRVLDYSDKPIDATPIEKHSPLKNVELIDISQEDSNDSVICETPSSQKKPVIWSKTPTGSAKKLDLLGDHIKDVLNRSLGDIEKVSDESDDEAADHSVNSSEKENDDEIQILTPVTHKSTPMNSLAVDLGVSPFANEKWLINHKTSFAESRREREEKIKRELTALDILHKESTLDRDLSQIIRRNLTLTDIIVLEEEKEELKLPEITDEMLKVIHGAQKSNDILRLPSNIEINKSDIKSLEPMQWLNDNVINSYLELIALRSKSHDKWPSVYVFTTFFYPKYLNEGYSRILSRWTRKVDVFSYDLLMFPIHLGIHWCLAVADLRSKTIKYYDSLGGKNYKCPKALLEYLGKEHQDKKNKPFDDSHWKTEIVEDIPQQQNGSDCGMFACKFAEYLSRDAELTFTQEDMNYYRQRMVYEIIAQDLLYP